MDPLEVAEHERIAAFRLVGRADGQTKMPCGVLVPVVLGEVGVLRVGVGLDVAPVAAQHVPTRLDQLAGVLDGCVVEVVLRHTTILPAPGPAGRCRDRSVACSRLSNVGESLQAIERQIEPERELDVVVAAAQAAFMTRRLRELAQGGEGH